MRWLDGPRDERPKPSLESIYTTLLREALLDAGKDPIVPLPRAKVHEALVTAAVRERRVERSRNRVAEREGRPSKPRSKLTVGRALKHIAQTRSFEELETIWRLGGVDAFRAIIKEMRCPTTPTAP